MQNLSSKKAQKKRKRKQQKDLHRLIHLFFIDHSAGALSELLNDLITHFLDNPDDWTDDFRNRVIIDTNAVTEFLTKLQESVSVMQTEK